ncbi:alginate O-acetyltransferase complex protein AlgJ [Paraburkholderia sp. GAS333]|uniref:alginate O-acetyltransferase AlgX-related protein n=1 Tax=Paraburkholderia sp. GAS333 TaxID=3156279 RepID=UPI003D259AA2
MNSPRSTIPATPDRTTSAPSDGEANAPRGSHRMTALCFGLLMAGGLLFGIQQTTHAGLGSLAPSQWLGGAAGTQLNNALRVPFHDTLETADAAWRYRVFGQLGAQVRQGCPGWLFYTDGLRAPVADPDAVVAARIALMRRLVAQLREQHVAVLAVTVPDKSRRESDALCGLTRPASTIAQLPRWQRALDEAGVARVDLSSVLDSVPKPFYRTDVHLNQRGAAAAAQAVATAALPLAGGRGTLQYDITRAAVATPRVGDLLTLAGLANAPQGWRPAPDSYRPETFTQPSAGGLLDTGPAVTVMLAGSSNSRRSNFAEQLGQSLGAPVWNVSRDGGKFADALMQSMEDRAHWPSTLKLVIWEMSEMSLVQPLNALEKAALRDGVHGDL